MTNEQLEALLALSGSDIGGMESEQERQVKLAEGLRSKMKSPANRKDWGTNLGNAGFGIAGALNDYKAQQATPAISAAKKKTFADIIRNLQRQGVGGAGAIPTVPGNQLPKPPIRLVEDDSELNPYST
jgi:hypothetical protein